jgi:hypothetical protein
MSTAILALNDMFGQVSMVRGNMLVMVMLQDIQCHHLTEGKADKAITQYCWVSGTFTVPGR